MLGSLRGSQPWQPRRHGRVATLTRNLPLERAISRSTEYPWSWCNQVGVAVHFESSRLLRMSDKQPACAMRLLKRMRRVCARDGSLKGPPQMDPRPYIVRYRLAPISSEGRATHTHTRHRECGGRTRVSRRTHTQTPSLLSTAHTHSSPRPDDCARVTRRTTPPAPYYLRLPSLPAVSALAASGA